MKKKTCTKCGIELEATPENFLRRKESKDGLRGVCRNCTRKTQREATKRFLKTDRGSEYISEYKQSDKCKESNKKYLSSEKGKKVKRTYCASKKGRRSLKNYDLRNPGKVTARCAKYRANKLQAIPPWANLEAIEAIYIECNRLTKETGIIHEVDHICALQSKTMCGLHIENNLQILTQAENRKKGNR